MDDMCTACLCTGRKLYFIGETGHYHLYSQILNEIPVYDFSDVCVRVCWECRALLRRFGEFKALVKRSYNELLLQVHQNIPPNKQSLARAPHLQVQQVVNLCYPEHEVKEEPCKDQDRDVLEGLPPDLEDIPEDFEEMPPSIEDVNVQDEFKVEIECDTFGEAWESEQVSAKKRKKALKEKAKTSKVKVKVKKKKLPQKRKRELDAEESELPTNGNSDCDIDAISDKEFSTDVGNNCDKRTGNEDCGKKRPKANGKIPERQPELIGDKTKCGECGKMFSSKKTYRYHLNTLHKGQNRYPCPRCGKVYQWKSNLGRHMRSHKIQMSNKKYTDEAFAIALEHIKNGDMTVYRASKAYNIPNQTLRDKINKKYKKESVGAPTVLSSTEEALLVKWVLHMTEIGFTVTKDQLLHSAAKLLLELERPNPFKDGIPGRRWYDAFLKRHPVITNKVCKALTTTENATEEKIKGWFERVREYFEEKNLMDVLDDPSRVFNCDEFAFFLCPKGEPVLARKEVINVHCRSDDKENFTLSLGASADGKLMPILALYPSQNILLKHPKDWTIGCTESGWMTSEAFFDYVANQFEPFLTKENITRPVALFLNGHVSYLSLQLCEFCKEKDIVLIALLPCATHALQPMDVVFHSLEKEWSKEVHTWRMENNGTRLKREDFDLVLEKAIERTLLPEIIENGFLKSGLFPFAENAINYGKIAKSSLVPETSSGTSTPTSFTSCRYNLKTL